MNDILFGVLMLLLIVASMITIIMFLIFSKKFREHEKGDTCDKIDINNPPNCGSNVVPPKNRDVIVFPLEDAEIEVTHHHPTNCKNCGAVLHSNTCEFCGTEYT